MTTPNSLNFDVVQIYTACGHHISPSPLQRSRDTGWAAVRTTPESEHRTTQFALFERLVAAYANAEQPN